MRFLHSTEQLVLINTLGGYIGLCLPLVFSDVSRYSLVISHPSQGDFYSLRAAASVVVALFCACRIYKEKAPLRVP